MTSYKLRTGNAGQVVRGDQTGQALLWDNTAQSWSPGLVDSSLDGVYNFASYEDLEAAFPANAGVHTLDDNGIYNFLSSFSLDGNRIVVTAQGALLTAAPFTVLESDVDGPTVRVDGAGTTVQGLTVWNNGATASDDRCAIEVTAQDVRLSGVHVLTQGDCPAVLVSNAAATVLAVGCQIQCGGSTPTRAGVRVEAGVFRGIGCERVGPAPLVASIGTSVSGIYLDDCFASASGAASDYFVFLSGVALGELLLSNCRMGENDEAAIQYAAGTVGFAAVVGCTALGVAGIDWAAASIPTRGLVVVGCNLNCTNPFVDFDEADAGVNVKACTGSAGLLSETAIVA